LEAARKVAKEAHEKYGVETVGLAADGSEKGSMEKLVENVLCKTPTRLTVDCVFLGPN